MPNVGRVVLPGFDAKTEKDPKNFSLYTDSDNVLIKEHSRGLEESIADGSSRDQVHNLGYSPHFYFYGETSSGRHRIVNNWQLYSGTWSVYTTDTKLIIQNRTGTGAHDGKFFIFYDNVD